MGNVNMEAEQIRFKNASYRNVAEGLNAALAGGGGLNSRVDALEETVGDAESGLVKDVNDLETVVGDAEGGLVKAVADLTTAVSAGLVLSSTEVKIGSYDGNDLFEKLYKVKLGSLSDYAYSGGKVSGNIELSADNINMAFIDIANSFVDVSSLGTAIQSFPVEYNSSSGFVRASISKSGSTYVAYFESSFLAENLNTGKANVDLYIAVKYTKTPANNNNR